MNLHELLEDQYGGDDGARELERQLASGANVDARGADGEAPLHVATRRRRLDAVRILLDGGASIDSENEFGKTAYAHAIRRGFDEVVELLRTRGARVELNDADRLAVAAVAKDVREMERILAQAPDAARTGNREEDRLLADLAGRFDVLPVLNLLIDAGADLVTPGLDDGTPLHQAAWFGQPQNARRLLLAGAPVDVFDKVHEASPLHWAAHGSRYSGGAEERQEVYVELVELLIGAGASFEYPDDPGGDAYAQRLLRDATPVVEEALRRGGVGGSGGRAGN